MCDGRTVGAACETVLGFAPLTESGSAFVTAVAAGAGLALGAVVRNSARS